MINYEKLINELSRSASYIIGALKTKYGHFFSPKKEKLLIEMSQDNNLVVIDTLVGDNKIHISPNHKVFQTGDYKLIKRYFEENVLVSEILRHFITLSLSEDESSCLEQANLHQKCRLFLRNGLISYISQEFCLGNRLVAPEERFVKNLEFIKELEETFPSFGNLKSLAFSKEYLYFCQKFYEQTGEDILAYYQSFLERTDSSELIEILEDNEDETVERGRR